MTIVEPAESVVVKTITELEPVGRGAKEVVDVTIVEPAESIVVKTITVGELDGAEEETRPDMVEQTAVFIDTVTVETPATSLNSSKAGSNAPQWRSFIVHNNTNNNVKIKLI